MALEGTNLYLKHIDLKTGRSDIREHRVWDAVKFYETQQAEAAKTAMRVELSTHEDYVEARKRR